MGGDHGHSKVSLPDWKQWKVEGTPMEFTKQRLAARGLKDPWARLVHFIHQKYLECLKFSVNTLIFPPISFRNETWRYSGGFSRAVTLSDVLFRGFKWGFAAFAVALAVEYTFFPPKKGGH